jgi:hypothetical protein
MISPFVATISSAIDEFTRRGLGEAILPKLVERAFVVSEARRFEWEFDFTDHLVPSSSTSINYPLSPIHYLLTSPSHPPTSPFPQITYPPNSLVGTSLSNIISNSSYVLPFISGTLYQHQAKQGKLSPPKKKPSLPFRFA